MNARIMLKVFGFALVVLATSSTTGCTHRTIIEEQVSDDSANEPGSGTVENEGAISNHPLYVRSGEVSPGETQSGPFPEPWQQRLGPFPEPWQRDGTGDKDDGKSPPPPSDDPNPNPDPNPKP